MSDYLDDKPFPRGPLIGAGLLIALTVGAVAVVQLTGMGAAYVAPAAVTLARDFRFIDRPDGSIAVYDARDSRLLDAVAPGTNGFVRGALRGLARERKRQGYGAEQPYRLAAGADGRLVLLDTATGRRVDLEAFGPANASAFARFLAAAARN
jgi:putative photosynthetic complex assembly protein